MTNAISPAYKKWIENDKTYFLYWIVKEGCLVRLMVEAEKLPPAENQTEGRDGMGIRVEVEANQ